jgi:transposase InsO family protein
MKNSIGELFTFPCKLSGEQGCLLFDSGAQVNLISANIVDAVGLQTQSCSVQLAWLNSQQLQVTRMVPKLTFGIGKHSFVIHNVLVTPLVNYDVVVGVKSHADLGCVIDFEHRKLHLRSVDGHRVTIIPSRHVIPPSSVFSAKPTVGLCSMEQFRQLAESDVVDLFMVQVTESGQVEVCSASQVDKEGDFEQLVEQAIGADCPPTMRERVKKLLCKYKSCFDPPSGLPPATPYDLKLRLKSGAKPFIASPYKLGSAEATHLAAKVRDMIAWQWIEPYSGSWGTPLIVIRKPGGGFRIVCDFRKVNEATEMESFPLPLIPSLLDQLGKSRWFSKLDLSSGYHQMRIHHESSHLTTFVTSLGSFRWNVLPQGLKQAPSVFSNYMAHVMKVFIDRQCLALYIDDLLYHTLHEEEHLVLLEEVFKVLSAHNLKASLPKCKFFTGSVGFLGHLVNQDGIKPGPDKVKAIQDYPTPTSAKQLHTFLGMVGWFKKFVVKYSDRVAPLQTCLTQALQVSSNCALTDFWTQSCDAAFADIKQALIDDVTLPFFDASLPTAVWTDSSSYAVGGVLLQKHTDNYGAVWRPVCFHSRKLTAAEINYDTRDRELVGALSCCEAWASYLKSREFLLITDHASLGKNWSTSKLQYARVARLFAKLDEFPKVHVYRRGDSNVVADALSRRPDHHSWFKHFSHSLDMGFRHIGVQCDGVVTVPVQGEDVNLAQLNFVVFDPKALFTEDLHKQLVTDASQVDPFVVRSQALQMRDDLWYTHSGKLYVDTDATRLLVVQFLHDQLLHVGIKKTLHKLKEICHWSNMLDDVKHVIKSCDLCQRAKGVCRPSNVKVQPMFHPAGVADAPTEPFQVLGIDFVWGLPGNVGFVTVLDLYSKYVQAFVVQPRVTGEQVAKLLYDNYFRYFGFPVRIVSDNDVRFMSLLWQECLALWNVKHSKTTVYHPKANGQVERVQATIVQLLRVLHAKGRDWKKELPYVCGIINSTVHRSLGFTPHEVAFGKKGSFFMENVEDDRQAYLEQLRSAARVNLETDAFQMEGADHGFDPSWLQPGIKVLLSTKKLRLARVAGSKLVPKFIGPFLVKSVHNGVSAVLDLPAHATFTNRWSIEYLRLYVDGDALGGDVTSFGYGLNDLVADDEVPVVSDSEIKSVSQLTWHSYKHGKNFFHVKFAGAMQYTEIMCEDAIRLLPNGSDLLKEYFEALRLRTRR